MPEAVVWVGFWVRWVEVREVMIAESTGLDQIKFTHGRVLHHRQAAKDAKKEAPKEVKEENAEKKDAAPSEPMSPGNQAQSRCAE